MSKKDLKDETAENAEQLNQSEDQVTENIAEGVDSQGLNGGDVLEKAQAEAAEYKDKYIRLLSDFDNHKKRTVKERLELMGSAAKDTLAALLPVLDDFDRAQNLPEEQKNTEAFQEGIKLVYQKLYNSLQQKGLEPMVSDGEVFDPELHLSLIHI